ncbi:MAG: hypothetical protein WD708_07925 [Kiritimatiellia bacterium]
MSRPIRREVIRKGGQRVGKEVIKEGVEQGGKNAVKRTGAGVGVRTGGGAIGKSLHGVPARDLPRLTRYADAADTPATRQLLLEAYQREGPGLFERIPSSLVLASGLTASMVYGTHRVTEVPNQMAEKVKEAPVEMVMDSINNTFRLLSVLTVFLAGLLILLLLRRFGLLHPPPAEQDPPAQPCVDSAEE